MRIFARSWWRVASRGTGVLVVLVLLLATCYTLRAATIDRIAALVDRQVLTVSEINQLAEIRFFSRKVQQSEDDYRREILDRLIAQALRYRDVERFGAEDIAADSIEARLKEIQQRFPTIADFNAALQRAELTLDEVRALVKRQIQVESYIQERFAPMIFVSSEEIENYYRGPWSQQRRERGLPIPPLSQVQEEIRALLKSSRLEQEVERWTAQLRSRANVDIYTWK
jgi:hypothetical protein